MSALKHPNKKQKLWIGGAQKREEKRVRNASVVVAMMVQSIQQGKDRKKDRWLTQLGFSYSKLNCQLRYVGVCKHQFWAFYVGLVPNVKRLLVLEKM